jgi:hypothetical protein
LIDAADSTRKEKETFFSDLIVGHAIHIRQLNYVLAMNLYYKGRVLEMLMIF